MHYCEHRLPCGATQIGRFRAVVGEAGLEQMLKATINTAVSIKAVKLEELERVIVDTTVQEKSIAHPVDSRLLVVARHKLVSAARRAGSLLKQTYAKEGKTLRHQAGGYANAKQFGRLKRVVKHQRTILGVFSARCGASAQQLRSPPTTPSLNRRFDLAVIFKRLVIAVLQTKPCPRSLSCPAEVGSQSP